jgi:hypothetical protein
MTRAGYIAHNNSGVYDSDGVRQTARIAKEFHALKTRGKIVNQVGYRLTATSKQEKLSSATEINFSSMDGMDNPKVTGTNE